MPEYLDPKNDLTFGISGEMAHFADLVVDYEKELYPIGKISFAQTRVANASVEKELINF